MGDNCYEEKRILKAAFTIFLGGLHGYCFHFNIVLFLRPFLFAEKFPEKGGAGTKGNPKKYQQKQGEKVLEETDVGRIQEMMGGFYDRLFCVVFSFGFSCQFMSVKIFVIGLQIFFLT